MPLHLSLSCPSRPLHLSSRPSRVRTLHPSAHAKLDLPAREVEVQEENPMNPNPRKLCGKNTTVKSSCLGSCLELFGSSLGLLPKTKKQTFTFSKLPTFSAFSTFSAFPTFFMFTWCLCLEVCLVCCAGGQSFLAVSIRVTFSSAAFFVSWSHNTVTRHSLSQLRGQNLHQTLPARLDSSLRSQVYAYETMYATLPISECVFQIQGMLILL